MKKLIALIGSLFTLPIVSAHCPLCTAAVGVAAVGAKYYGIDDSIIGLFIGAFSISVGLWFGLKILKKNYIRFQMPLIIILSFVLTVIPIIYSINSNSLYMPLLLFGEAGSLFNKVYWVNKMLLGSIIGSVVTLVGYWVHVKIKEFHGRVLFPFQGMIITIVLLVLTGVIQYFVFK